MANALAQVPLLSMHFQGKTLDTVEFEVIKKAIREEEGGEKRKELERAIEAITKLEAVGVSDSTAILAEQTSLIGLLSSRDELLAATRGDLFKRLYEAADTLIDEGDWQDTSQCPLCFSKLDRSIKTHIDEQLNQYREVADSITQVRQHWQSAQWVTRLSLLEKTEATVAGSMPRNLTSLAQKAAAGTLTVDELVEATERLAARMAVDDDVVGRIREHDGCTAMLHQGGERSFVSSIPAEDPVLAQAPEISWSGDDLGCFFGKLVSRILLGRRFAED